MRKTVFSPLAIIIALTLSISLTSCAKQCTVMLTNTQTGEQRAFPDTDCDGIADFQDSTPNGGGGSAVSGTIIFTGSGVIQNLSGTSTVGYANDGDGNALTYSGTANVSTQDRLISFSIPTPGGTLVKRALINQDLVAELQIASGEINLTNAVVDAFDRKDVTAMQAYINNDQKIITIDYMGEPETTPLWSSMGSDSYRQSTGQLNGHPVHYRIIGWRVEYVKNVFRIQ